MIRQGSGSGPLGSRGFPRSESFQRDDRETEDKDEGNTCDLIFNVLIGCRCQVTLLWWHKKSEQSLPSHPYVMPIPT